MGSRGAMICCLLLSIFLSLIGMSYPQATIIRDGGLRMQLATLYSIG